MKRERLKDQTLQFLLDFEEGPSVERPGFTEIIKILGSDWHELTDVCNEMEKEGYIKTLKAESVGIVKIFLTTSGAAFLKLEGGYTPQAAEEIRLKELRERLDNSVITTNNSVLSNNRLQKWLLAVTTILSAASVVVSVLSYYKDDRVVVNPAPAQVRNQIILSPNDTSKAVRFHTVHKNK